MHADVDPRARSQRLTAASAPSNSTIIGPPQASISNESTAGESALQEIYRQIAELRGRQNALQNVVVELLAKQAADSLEKLHIDPEKMEDA